MEKRLKAYEVLKDSIARDSEEPADEDSGTDRSDPARRPAGQEQLVPAGSPRSGGRKPAKGDVKAICRKSLRAKSRIDKLEKLIEPFKAWEEVLEEYMRFDSEEPDDEDSWQARSDPAWRPPAGQKRRDASGYPRSGGRKPARGMRIRSAWKRPPAERQSDIIPRRSKAYDVLAVLEESNSGDSPEPAD